MLLHSRLHMLRSARDTVDSGLRLHLLRLRVDELLTGLWLTLRLHFGMLLIPLLLLGRSSLLRVRWWLSHLSRRGTGCLSLRGRLGIVLGMYRAWAVDRKALMQDMRRW